MKPPPESMMDRAMALLAKMDKESLAKEEDATPPKEGDAKTPPRQSRAAEPKDIPSLAGSAYFIMGAIAIIVCSVALGIWIGVFGGVIMLAAGIASASNRKK